MHRQLGAPTSGVGPALRLARPRTRSHTRQRRPKRQRGAVDAGLRLSPTTPPDGALDGEGLGAPGSSSPAQAASPKGARRARGRVVVGEGRR